MHVSITRELVARPSIYLRTDDTFGHTWPKLSPSVQNSVKSPWWWNASLRSAVLLDSLRK